MKDEKRWEKPKLIIVERGEAQENILISCNVEAPSTGAGDMQGGCYNYESATCSSCSSLVTS